MSKSKLESRLYEFVWVAVTRYIVYSVALLTILTSCQSSISQEIPVYGMGPSDIFDDPMAAELAVAAGGGELDQIDRLVGEGVLVDSRGVYGITPLWWPLQRQNKRGFEKLLQLGADVNHQWETGQSVMSHAPAIEDSYFLELALNYGGDPNLVNPRSKRTPLFDAVRSPYPYSKSVKLLIQAGAILDVRDAAGFPPIIWAAISDRYDAIFEMIEAGADYKMVTLNSGRDIGFYMNRRRGREKDVSGMAEWRQRVVTLLFEKGYSIPGELY